MIKSTIEKLFLLVIFSLSTTSLYGNSQEDQFQGIWGTITNAVSSVFHWSTNAVNRALKKERPEFNQHILALVEEQKNAQQQIEQGILPYLGSNLDKNLLETSLKTALDQQSRNGTPHYTAIVQDTAKTINNILAPERETYLKNSTEIASIDSSLRTCQPSWTAQAGKWLGYGVVFTAGPLAGNYVYNKYLKNYFEQSINPADLEKALEKQKIKLELLKADNAAEAAIKKLEQSIEQQEKILQAARERLSDPAQPPAVSLWKKIGGVATRVGLMAATTGLLYVIHKNTVGKWATVPAGAAETLLNLQKMRQPLVTFNRNFEIKQATAHKIDDLAKKLQPNNPSYADDLANNLVAGYARLVSIEKSIEEYKTAAQQTHMHNRLRWLILLLGNIGQHQF